MRNRWLSGWRRWRAGLRRDQLAVALCLLTIGVGEPLLCVLHCQIWMPFAHQRYFGRQHQHHAAHGAQAGAASPGAPGGQHRECFMLSGSDSAPVPMHVPPSPVRDLLLTLVLACAVIVRSRACRVRLTRGPPRLAYPPPLRPPIAQAA